MLQYMHRSDTVNAASIRSDIIALHTKFGVDSLEQKCSSSR